jgi:hypothetical protein
MTDLLAARSQMAMSLGFHIVFAVVGIVALAEGSGDVGAQAASQKEPSPVHP